MDRKYWLMISILQKQATPTCVHLNNFPNKSLFFVVRIMHQNSSRLKYYACSSRSCVRVSLFLQSTNIFLHLTQYPYIQTLLFNQMSCHKCNISTDNNYSGLKQDACEEHFTCRFASVTPWFAK